MTAGAPSGRNTVIPVLLFSLSLNAWYLSFQGKFLNLDQ